MSYRNNDLAIILTRKIEIAVVDICMQVSRVDEKRLREAPNFYMIRTAILRTLEKYIDVLAIDMGSSPHAESEYTDEIIKQIRDLEIKNIAAGIVEQVVRSKEHFLVIETEDDFSRWRNTRREIMVLKTALVEEDSRTKAKDYEGI